MSWFLLIFEYNLEAFSVLQCGILTMINNPTLSFIPKGSHISWCFLLLENNMEAILVCQYVDIWNQVTDLKLLPYRPNTSPPVNVFQSLMWQMFCNKCLFTTAFLFKALFQLLIKSSCWYSVIVSMLSCPCDLFLTEPTL